MEKRNVPKLRFKGFEDEWKEKKLGDICTMFSGGTPESKNKEYYKGNIPFIRSGEINSEKTELNINKNALDNSSAKIVKKGDLLYALYGATSGEVGVAKLDGAINQAVLCIRTNYLSVNYLLNLLKYKKDNIVNTYIQGGQGNLSATIIKKLNYYIPSLEEQRKIANFLSKVDKIIEEQDLKVKDLELYKKGIMQKIFKQEIRFKDDNGENYPKWEEKKLGELGYTYTGLSGKTKENFGFGNGKYVTYMNVFKNIKIDTNMIDLVDISEDEKQNNVFKGDLLFTTSSETPEEVGMVSVCDKDIQGLYLNSFCFGFRLNELNNINFYFMAYYLRSSEIRLKISILAQGSTRYNLSKTELMKLKLKIPSLEEQTKIANFLSNIDKIIEEENKKLEDLRLWKHGLLQQMFV